MIPKQKEQYIVRSVALRSLVVVLALGCLLAGACTPDGASANLVGQSVILISFDTCRADVFGVLTGEEPSLTPRLDELAADSVVFERAFVQIPHTLPSHMSMLTSVYPDAHGVKPDLDPLPAALVTLPEILDREGYRTLGFVTSEWLKPGFGFGRGFDEYERLSHDWTYADRVNAAALGALDGAVGSQFVFLHYYDLHSDFGQGGTRNKLPYYSPLFFRTGLDVSSDGREFCDEGGSCGTWYLISSDKKRRDLSPSEIEAIHALYRAAVPNLDAEMGKLFDELRRRGLYDGSLIVVTSDHGEEFREHGRFIHSQPYDETTHVPLFVKFPRSWRAGTRIAEVVETVDIAPTILDYLGLAIPEQAQGESLMGLVEGGVVRDKTAVLSQDSITQARYGLRTKDMKLISNLERPGRELYDLLNDPGESVNLAADRSDLADELERRLKRLVVATRRLNRELATGEGAGEDLLSEGEKKRLESLGYVN